MRPSSCLSLLAAVSMLAFACHLSTVVSKTSDAPSNYSRRVVAKEPIELKQFQDFVTGDTVSIEGFRAVKRHKTARTAEYPKPIDVTYAVITRNGRPLVTFDGFAGVYHPMGADTDFGLFSFLPTSSKQLLIEQTQWRNWAYWIVTFSPRYRVIFDGRKWGVNRELMYGDIDGDGIYEISQAVTAFAFFEDLTNATSHLVDITFKYDPTRQEYLPANQLLQSYSLAGIDDEIKALDKSDAHKFESEILLIVLRYIYAGKLNEAWSFYDREYNLGDKERLRGKILVTLRHEPVYKFLYH
jgi:hypothetical protein